MSAHGTPLPAGTQVGEYVIQRLLDQDGYGLHYRAQHAVQGAVLLHELFAPEFVRRGANGLDVEALDTEDRVALRWWTRNYLERARQLAAVQHPALLPIASAFEANGTAWHASPAITATSLQSLLARHVAFDEARADRLLLDLLDALGGLREAKVLHRGLNPQQIWVRDDGSCVVGGFGSLRAPLRFHARMLHSVMQEPYAAPEEHRADATPTPAADLYAAAAIAYHAIGGEPPPSAEQRAQGAALVPLATLAPGRVRASTAAAIEGALALDAAARWPAVEEWRRTLHAPSIPSRPAVAPAPQPAPRRSLALLLGVPALLLALGLGAWWAARTVPTPVDDTAQQPPAVPGSAQQVAAADMAAEGETQATALPDETAADTAFETAAAPLATAPVVTPVPTPITQTVALRPEATPAPTATTAPTPLPRAVVVADAATPAPRASASGTAAVRPGSVEVASLIPPAPEPVDPAEFAKAEEERKRGEHAQQLALERSRCGRHVSELFDGREFTYADIARFKDVVKLADGRLQTPPMRTDDGRRFAFLIDTGGCVVRMLR